MKLCRIGDAGNEKPAIIDKESNYRDLSSIINDLNPDTLNFETLEKMKRLKFQNFQSWNKVQELDHVFQNHQNLSV